MSCENPIGSNVMESPNRRLPAKASEDSLPFRYGSFLAVLGPFVYPPLPPFDGPSTAWPLSERKERHNFMKFCKWEGTHSR